MEPIRRFRIVYLIYEKNSRINLIRTYYLQYIVNAANMKRYKMPSIIPESPKAIRKPRNTIKPIELTVLNCTIKYIMYNS